MTEYGSAYVTLEDGLKLHYLEAGEGPVVLLLHGWPTSSFLWRKTLVPLARTNRAIALDLPAFGLSDKPLDVSYSFRFYNRVLEGFLDALDIDTVGLAVHDLGGPLGLYWAVHHPHRIRKLALLNTLIYPSVIDPAVIAFVLASRIPILRDLLASPRGLAFALRYGLGDQAFATPEAIAGVQAPFANKNAREALLRTASSLHPGGFRDIVQKLPTEFKSHPIRLIYGTRDRILPRVRTTMARVARELPQAVTTRLEGAGHFCQEERGEEMGTLLCDFFAEGEP